MSLSPLQSPSLSALPGIRHAFFTREGGVSQGIYASLNGGMGSSDDRAKVMENRLLMAAHLAVQPGHFLNVWQIHSADCMTVDGPWPGEERPKADAMATRIPGIALAIATADCGPILFADPGARVVGAAHAGWKGAIGGVLEATLDAMERLGARRADIAVTIGPMLSQANYEVGPEFFERFIAEAAANADFFKPSVKAGHAMFDLPGYIRRRLAAAGVAAIDDLARCTYADETRFYSYRRVTHRKEADYGRLMSAIVLA
jgi:polyphenol oxidase